MLKRSTCETNNLFYNYLRHQLIRHPTERTVSPEREANHQPTEGNRTMGTSAWKKTLILITHAASLVIRFSSMIN